jgi:hypothetical protein
MSEAIDKLHSIWDKFIADVTEVIRSVEPEAEKDAETLAADAVAAAETAAAHNLDRAEPQSNVAPEPEASTPADSSVPTEPAAPVTEPPSNIDPAEDQTGDTVGAAQGTVGVDAPAAVATTTETFGVGETPADSVSLGTEATTMPVAADPAATAAAAEAEALAHPSVSGTA